MCVETTTPCLVFTKSSFTWRRRRRRRTPPPKKSTPILFIHLLDTETISHQHHFFPKLLPSCVKSDFISVGTAEKREMLSLPSTSCHQFFLDDWFHYYERYYSHNRALLPERVKTQPPTSLLRRLLLLLAPLLTSSVHINPIPWDFTARQL